MHTPQILYIASTAWVLGIAAASHGKSRGKFNFYFSVFDEVALLSLLYWGGFFTH